MIRSVKRKTIQNFIISVLLVFCCLSGTFKRSFLIVNAASSIHGRYTYTGGRLEWEVNTFDSVQDIEVDGTTYRAGAIIISDFYLNNTSTGTLRFYWSGFNQGYYNAMNVYVFGSTISNIGYSGTSSGVTLKLNEAVDHIKVVITFNNTDINTSLSSFSPVVASSLTAVTSSDTAVTQIDVKLAGVASTLSQILAILGSGNVSITDYLEDINAYAAYLEDLTGYIENIDDQIDTITWLSIPVTYKGYTTDYINFNTDTYGYHDAGWYVLENPDFSSSVSSGIYKLTIPLGAASTTFDNIQFAQYWSDAWRSFTPDNYLYYPTRNYIIIYFTVGETYHQWPQSNYPFGIYVDKQMYKYSAYQFKLEYILQTDIEYWDLYKSIQTNKLIQLVNVLASGVDASSITDQIDQKTDDLNDAANQSQIIEQQQLQNLESFNNSIDLDDYNFNFDVRNGIEYFKLKLTNIYDIQEFKPFYLIPIILFVLMAILRG